MIESITIILSLVANFIFMVAIADYRRRLKRANAALTSRIMEKPERIMEKPEALVEIKRGKGIRYVKKQR